MNGVTDTARQALFEAVQQPASGFVEEWSPNDTDGQFFKIDRAFSSITPAASRRSATAFGKLHHNRWGQEREHRWNFNYRAADRRERLQQHLCAGGRVELAGPSRRTWRRLDLVDVEQWMRIFATEHIIVNFDAYGHDW